MIHPDFELVHLSEEEGFGVVAKRFIPKGTITSTISPFDPVFTPSHLLELPEAHQAYVKHFGYRISNGNYVIDWDIGRWINHSIHNTEVLTVYGLGLASRDMHPGDQLTADYGTLNYDGVRFLPRPEESAGGAIARTEIKRDDQLRCYRHWDEQLREVFPCFNKVDQPLAKYIPPEFQEKVKAIAAGQVKFDSTIGTLYDDQKQVEIK